MPRGSPAGGRSRLASWASRRPRCATGVMKRSSWPLGFRRSRRLRFQDADLHQHPREVIDSALVDNMAIVESEQEHDRNSERLAGRGQSHEAAKVRSLGRGEQCRTVAIDDPLLLVNDLIRKGAP